MGIKTRINHGLEVDLKNTARGLDHFEVQMTENVTAKFRLAEMQSLKLRIRYALETKSDVMMMGQNKKARFIHIIG